MWNNVNLQYRHFLMTNIKNYLTVRQVAKQLDLTEYRIRELIREKQIRATKIGQWKINPEDLQEFIRARTNR